MFVVMNVAKVSAERREALEEAFRGWVSSDLFRKSHKPRPGGPLAHGNELRTYEVIDVEAAAEA